MQVAEREAGLERHSIRRVANRLAHALSGPGSFEWIVLGVFTTLLALVTLHHEMWRDELQAWLIARDTHSIPQLLHALHYEGHPALWYLLLWIPAHFSPNPASMQVVNFLVAVALAWVVLSAGALPRAARVLIVFSFFFFYQYGVTARSYELAALLLIAAARCLAGPRQHRKLAILLLALSINTHVFAVPVAVALAFWAFYAAKLRTWKSAHRMLLDREFLIAFLALLLAGAVALITVWPAKDLARIDSFQPAISTDFLASLAMLWQAFVPHLPSPVQILLIRPLSSLAVRCFASVLTVALAAALFRTAAARWFFLACTILETAVLAATVGSPDVYHLGILFAAFVVALLLDASIAPDRRPFRVPAKAASVLLYGLLVAQMLCAVDLSVRDWIQPCSGARQAALWLKSNHLSRNPLVLQPSEFTNGIVAYLERPSAYYPSCRCFGSYQIRNTSAQRYRMATPADLRTARGSSRLPVILVSNRKLTPDYNRSLGLAEIYRTSPRAMVSDEVFFIYRQVRPPA